MIIFNDVIVKPKVYNKHHGNAPIGSIYIGRGSKYGNPYVIGEPHPITGKPMTRDDVCDLFEKDVLPNLDVSELKGKNLICFCKPHRCHGDPILIKANKE